MFVPFSKNLEIMRYTDKPKLNEDGIYELSEMYRFTVFASVQPMRSNEMQALPEGRRVSRAVKVYTKKDQPLQMADQKTGLQADRFYYLGRLFEVVASDIYCNDQINHNRAYATEVTDH